MKTQGECDVCDDSVAISFSSSKVFVPMLLNLIWGQDAIWVQANNKGFDCRGLLTGVSATLGCLGRDHTEKESRAEPYL